MKLNELFKQVGLINKMLDGQLLEISVRQHQVTLSIKDSLVYFPQIKKMLDFSDDSKSFVSFSDDIFYFVFVNLSSEDMTDKDIFYPFLKTIEDFAEKICTCPSLEFIISPQYLKCFLDKPGLKVGNLREYEEVLGAEGEGELELHPQRPYLLFINENSEG